MVTDRFERLFRRMVAVFKRHQDVPRSPANIAELGAARWDLELARKAIAEERERITARVAVRSVMPRKVALSDDELARLRVSGIGSVSG